jgi:hypothetical protein
VILEKLEERGLLFRRSTVEGLRAENEQLKTRLSEFVSVA